MRRLLNLFLPSTKTCRDLATLIVEGGRGIERREIGMHQLLFVACIAFGMLTLQAAGPFAVQGMGYVDAAVW